MPKFTTEDVVPAAEIGLNPAADWNKDDPLDDVDVVDTAKLSTGFDGLKTNPPFVDDVPTDGGLATLGDTAPTVDGGGNIGLNSMPAAAAELAETDDECDDDDVTDKAVAARVDGVTAGLLTLD